MRFVWDTNKAAGNILKHGMGFEEASTVFLDGLSATGADPDHFIGDERWLTFGTSTWGNFLVVVHTDQGDTTRIISARLGTERERKLYEET